MVQTIIIKLKNPDGHENCEVSQLLIYHENSYILTQFLNSSEFTFQTTKPDVEKSWILGLSL